MRIAIVGAGVVGVTTAHFLAEQGCEVTLIEQAGAAGLGASKANGAQLSYSFTDAMADPSLLPKLLPILLGRDPAFRMLPRLSPHFVRWGLSFLANCASRKATSNSQQLLTLALRSAELMQAFHQRFGQQYRYRRAGKLVLLPQSPDPAQQQKIEHKRAQGCDVEIISADRAMEIEPSLRQWSQTPAAAIYSASDEAADAALFCQTLTTHLADRGVQCRFKESATAVICAQGQVRAVQTCQGEIAADAVVLCNGGYANELLKPLGVQLPIYPVTGYSVTLDGADQCPNTSITALDQKIVFSRLGEQIRIAGFADINPNPKYHQRRVNQLIHTARQLAPAAADYDTVANQAWVGHRPMTPNSLPISGPSKIPGLYLNCGHGMFGWTLCAASAESLTHTIVGQASGKNDLLASSASI